MRIISSVCLQGRIKVVVWLLSPVDKSTGMLYCFSLAPRPNFLHSFSVLTHCSLFLFCFPVRCLIDALTMLLCFLLAAQRLLEQVITLLHRKEQQCPNVQPIFSPKIILSRLENKVRYYVSKKLLDFLNWGEI